MKQHLYVEYPQEYPQNFIATWALNHSRTGFH